MLRDFLCAFSWWYSMREMRCFEIPPSRNYSIPSIFPRYFPPRVANPEISRFRNRWNNSRPWNEISQTRNSFWDDDRKGGRIFLSTQGRNRRMGLFESLGPIFDVKRTVSFPAASRGEMRDATRPAVSGAMRGAFCGCSFQTRKRERLFVAKCVQKTE